MIESSPVVHAFVELLYLFSGFNLANDMFCSLVSRGNQTLKDGAASSSLA